MMAESRRDGVLMGSYFIVDILIAIRCAILIELTRIGSESALAVLRGSEVFEAVLVDLQRPDLRLQCGAWHTEPGSRAEGSVHPSSAFAQRSLNDFFFLRRKLREYANLFGGLSRTGLPRKPTLVDCEIVRFTDNDRSLNHVLQFANVS